MKKLFLYPISVIYYFFFLVVLLIFHPVQWFCFNVFGYQAHKKSADIMTFCLIKCSHILGTRYTFENRDLIPKNVPLIIVSNHQSLFDTTGIIWYLRKFHCWFVTKKELGKGLPSVSYYLRHGKSVLIDRNNPKQAIPLIKSLSEYIEKHKHSAVIFPEGTRSKTGHPKEFAESGLKILCKYAPSAYIVPISINNSWKVFQYGSIPLSLGHHLVFTVHKPFKVSDYTFEELMNKTKKTIVEGIKV